MTTSGTGQMPAGPASMQASAVVTAGAALVVGLLLIIGADLPRTDGIADYSGLGWVAVVLGAIALVLVGFASYDWQGSNTDGLAWLRRFFGPAGVAARLATPLGWVAAAVGAVIVATIALPTVIPGWTADAVFNVGLLVFAALAVIGWAPAASRGWPAGLTVSPLSVIGSLVAIALVGAFLFFLWLLSTKTSASADEWARLVEIRATLEALAFAAAGALIGQTVTRSAVSGELEKKDEQLVAKDEAIGAKQEKLAEALNHITPTAVTVTPESFSTLNLDSVMGAAASTEEVRLARESLIEGLLVEPKA